MSDIVLSLGLIGSRIMPINGLQFTATRSSAQLTLSENILEVRDLPHFLVSNEIGNYYATMHAVTMGVSPLLELKNEETTIYSTCYKIT